MEPRYVTDRKWAELAGVESARMVREALGARWRGGISSGTWFDAHRGAAVAWAMTAVRRYRLAFDGCAMGGPFDCREA